MTAPREDFFPESALIRRITSEPALYLGAGRALLLQVAHPVVARGVRDHSDFRTNPFTRLVGTLEGTLSIVHGSRELAEGVGRRIRWIHDHVTGPTYRAADPENLLWVHATLLDTAIRCHTELVRPLSPGEQATVYEEMARVAGLFGLPRDEMPATVQDFHAYFAETVERMEVTAVGRDLAGFVLRPQLPLRLEWPLSPALSVHRAFTVAMTPPPIREQLGITLDARTRRRHHRMRGGARRLMRATPARARTAPAVLATRMLMHRARRHVAEFEETPVTVPTGSVRDQPRGEPPGPP